MNNLSVSASSTSNISNTLSNTKITSESENDSFKQLLSYMLLSSIGNGSESHSNISSLLSPLMLLLEQVQSQQLNSEMTSLSNTGILYSPSSNASAVQDTKYPVNGPITQEFHSGHIGLDLGVVVGTPVKSSIEGKVTYAGWNNEGYGNLVIVDNGTYKTYYAHLSDVPVSVGQTVNKDEVIGLSGNTGNSTGPHLHYEVRKNGQPIDPASFDPDNL